LKITLEKKMKIFKKKQKRISVSGRIGIIQPTEVALRNNTLDKFNHKIVIYDGILFNGEEVIYGRVLEEMPFHEINVENLTNIKEIPIVARRNKQAEQFFQEPAFGEIVQ